MIKEQTFRGLPVPHGWEVWSTGVYQRTISFDDAPLAENDQNDPDLPSLFDIGGRCGDATQPVPPDRIRILGLKPAGPPCRIDALAIDIASKVSMVRIEWPHWAGHVSTVWVGADEVASRSRAMALSRHGLHISEKNATLFTSWIADYLRFNASRLPVLHVASRYGWVEGSLAGQDGEGGGTAGACAAGACAAGAVGAGTADAPIGTPAGDPELSRGWLLGRTYISLSGDREIQFNPTADSLSGPGFTRRGHLAAWREKEAWLYEVALEPQVARWLNNSCFAAPLIRHTGARSFVVHHAHETGAGKTAMGKFGLSVWGDPNELIATLDSTPKAAIQLSRGISDLALVFDELQANAKRNDPLVFRDFIYQIVGGKGRLRLRGDGKISTEGDPMAETKLIVRTTGEGALIPQTQMRHTGDANRLIQFRSETLRSHDGQEIHKWFEGHDCCWGEPGIQFLLDLRRLIRKHGARWLEQARIEVAESIEYAVGLAPESGNQWIMHLSVVGLAQQLRRMFEDENWRQGGDSWLEKEDWNDFGTKESIHLDEVVEDALAIWVRMEQRDARRPGQILTERLRNSLVQQADMWITEHGGTSFRRDALGIKPGHTHPDEWIWVFPDKFEWICRQNDTSPDLVLHDLFRVGLVDNPKKPSVRSSAYHDDPVSVYVIRKEKEETT